MDTEKKNRIREIVREVMDGKVSSLVENDIFTDNEVRDRVNDELPLDMLNDEEVEKCILEGVDGFIDNGVYEMFVDTLTDAFMERFK